MHVYYLSEGASEHESGEKRFFVLPSGYYYAVGMSGGPDRSGILHHLMIEHSSLLPYDP